LKPNIDLKAALLVLIMGAGAALRLTDITQPFSDAFSWRQSDTAGIADQFLRGHWNIFLPKIGWNGPGDNFVGYEFQSVTFLASLLYRVLGQADWVARGLSVAFGLWGIFAFHRLVRLTRGETEALVAATLLALHPAVAFVDRSFLPDPAMTAMTVTALWWLVVFAETGRRLALVAAVAAGTLAALTKITALIVGLAVIYVLVVEARRSRFELTVRPALWGLALLALGVGAYYGWAVHVSRAYPPFHVAAHDNWIWNHPPATILERGFWFGVIAHHGFWLIPAFLTPFMALGLTVGRRSAEAAWPFIFHFWLLGGFLLIVFGAKELGENPWNIQILQPPLMALAGAGVVWSGRVAGRFIAGRRWALRLPPMAIPVTSVLACACVAALLWHQRRVAWAYHPYAGQSVLLGAALAEASQPDDLVATIAEAVGDPTPLLYSRRRGWVFPPPGSAVPWASQSIPSSAGIAAFDDLRRRGLCLFGMVAEQRAKLALSSPELLAHIEAHTHPVASNRNYTIVQIPEGNCGRRTIGSATGP
jgi:uncharacterized membrane protein YuzA (DUF378 family)